MSAISGPDASQRFHCLTTGSLFRGSWPTTRNPMGAIGETGSFYWRVAERDHQEGDDVSNSGEVTTVEMTHTMSDNSDDLTPLRAFTGLKTLTINGGPLRLDLPPLTSTPLESLTCRELIAHRNAHILKSMPKLTTTDAQPEPIAVSTSVINTEP